MQKNNKIANTSITVGIMNIVILQLWTNQRPVSRSRDHSRPIRSLYPGHVITLDKSELQYCNCATSVVVFKVSKLIYNSPLKTTHWEWLTTHISAEPKCCFKNLLKGVLDMMQRDAKRHAICHMSWVNSFLWVIIHYCFTEPVSCLCRSGWVLTILLTVKTSLLFWRCVHFYVTASSSMLLVNPDLKSGCVWTKWQNVVLGTSSWYILCVCCQYCPPTLVSTN